MARHAAAMMAGVAEELYFHTPGEPGLGMALFTHATHFLGYKVG